MTFLNVTYGGYSKNIAEIEFSLSDEDVKRVAYDIIRTTIHFSDMCIVDAPFEQYVVDRFPPNRVYLRPKVPFGVK